MAGCNSTCASSDSSTIVESREPPPSLSWSRWPSRHSDDGDDGTRQAPKLLEPSLNLESVPLNGGTDASKSAQKSRAAARPPVEMSLNFLQPAAHDDGGQFESSSCACAAVNRCIEESITRFHCAVRTRATFSRVAQRFGSRLNGCCAVRRVLLLVSIARQLRAVVFGHNSVAAFSHFCAIF